MKRVLQGSLLASILVFMACDTPQRIESSVNRVTPPTTATDGRSDASADTNIADTNIADTNIADTNIADTNIADTNIADTNIADTNIADTNIADTNIADTNVADTRPPADTNTGPTDVSDPDVAAYGEECRVGAVSGICLHVADCYDTEAAVEGFCEGGPQVRCCLEAWDRCSANRRPGACIDTADCPGPDWATTSGLCPGPSTVRCCTSSAPAQTCDPAVKPDPNAGLDLYAQELGDDGCPDGMARISRAGDFCIDRFEASLILDSDPTVTLSPYHNPGSTAVRAVSNRYAVPQGYIDEVRAKAACVNAGKRLCTSTEWLSACQGESNWTYPYGPTREPGRCNDDRSLHVAIEFFGPNDPNPFSKINNACLSQLANSLDLSGENEGCQTPEGVYDLMGNLHEWIDDDAGTFRGGFYSDTVINGNGCLYRTTAHDVSHWDYSTGFRCCADPE